jgi:hypothetical protein
MGVILCAAKPIVQWYKASTNGRYGSGGPGKAASSNVKSLKFVVEILNLTVFIERW